ncbi:unnamed protein product [Musa acuminata subsp. burmannicoides]
MEFTIMNFHDFNCIYGGVFVLSTQNIRIGTNHLSCNINPQIICLTASLRIRRSRGSNFQGQWKCYMFFLGPKDRAPTWRVNDSHEQP